MSESYDFLWALDRRDRGSKLRLGMAQVRSVEGDPVFGTVTGQAVIVPAANDWFTAEAVAARYLSEYPPRPGASCWYATDGNDVLILGMTAPEGPPYGRLRITSATAIVTATNTTLSWPTVSNDSWNMNNSGTALRAPLTGLYDIAAWVSWASNATGNRRTEILINGSNQIFARDAAASGVGNAQFSNLVWPLDVGDLVQVRVLQSSGGNLDVSDAALTMSYLGRTRSTSTSNALSTQRFPNGPVSAWDTTQSTAATDTIDTRSGNPSFTFTTNAGTFTNIAYSPEVIPVVPRQRYTIAGSAQTSVILGASEGIVMFLLCAPDGTPNPALSTSSTASGFSTATLGTANAFYAISNGEQIIPDGCFTARLGIRVNSTATKVVSFTSLSATEKVY